MAATARKSENLGAFPAGQDAGRRRWQESLRQAVRSVDALWEALELPQHALQGARAAHGAFPVCVPPAHLARMSKGCLQDPLLVQVAPLGQELAETPGFGADPLCEQCGPNQGVLRKYRSRALLITTGACAVHCRYCFRRHFPYAEHVQRHEWWRKPLDLLAEAPEVDEIILSGGDPLTLPDTIIRQILARIAEIPHIRRVRFHTRTPIVMPERIDEGFLAALKAFPRTLVMVVHANHPREVDEPVRSMAGTLRGAGVLLFNQAVLLKNVNDDPEVLADLGAGLIDAGITPYYLHALDPVAGAAHFAVSDDRARAIVADMHALTAGICIPRLVREVPGRESKIPLDLRLE